MAPSICLSINLRQANLLRHFKKVIELEELPAIRYHDLGHNHTTLLLIAETNSRAVQERLSHTSISVTFDVYSHVIPSLQDEAAEQFGAIFVKYFVYLLLKACVLCT